MMGLKRKCRVHMLGRILGFALCCGLPGPVDAQAQYHHLDVAVHASSWYSTGSAHIEEVAQAAAAMGFDALILTDADVLQVEYGLPFFRNIFAFSSEQPALLSENALGDYLAEIQRVDETMENFVLIDGVESRPFYFWSKTQTKIFGIKLIGPSYPRIQMLSTSWKKTSIILFGGLYLATRTPSTS
mgnify:CR=1 FL=1